MSLWHQYVLKPRTIYASSSLQTLRRTETSPGIQIGIVSDYDAIDLKKLYSPFFQDPDTLDCRIKSQSWLGLLARTSDGKPVGMYWGFVPQENPGWHDSFRVAIGNALACNAFVHPDSRGQRIYGALAWMLHTILFREYRCKLIFTIIERANTSSHRSNRRLGLEVWGQNWLLKFVGRNVFSVVRKRGERPVIYRLISLK